MEDFATAFIGFYDLNGRQISILPIDKGADHVMFTNNNMQPGMYVYSLIVDDQLIDSKKMVIME